jgi:hypothetical protein
VQNRWFANAIDSESIGCVVKQRKLTVIVNVKDGCAHDLKNTLSAAGDDVIGNNLIRFNQSPSTHFARFVVLDRGPKCRLLFSTCYSGDFAQYIQELVSSVGRGLEKIFSSCQEYTPGIWLDIAKAREFVRRHDVGYQVFVTAFPGTSPAEILKNQRIRQNLDTLLDGPSSRAVIESLFPNGLSIPVPKTSGAGTGPSKLTNFLDSLFVRKRTADSNVIVKTSTDLIEVEDRVVQNQMTVISPNGPVLSRLVLRGVFLLTQTRMHLASSISTLPTIHFAQWSILDGGDNLLFESNYDGTWENYIDDFVDYAFLGLDAIWGQSPVYPPGGSRNIEAFKSVIRNEQYPAQVFYSAYPDCSVQNINDDIALNQALATLVSDERFRRFLSGSHTQRVQIADRA